MNREVAEAVAPGWERRRAFIETSSAPVRQWLIRELAPRSGDTILELAAGAGDTGFEAAALVGEDGRVISTDVSPAMVEVARRRGAALGVTNVDYQVMDAEQIELEDASVDGVLCRFGYMLMTDPPKALSETRRVLRSGQRVALAVFAGPERNPFFATIAMTLVVGGHLPPPDPAGPGIFSMASEERTRELLGGAGFGAVRTEDVPVRFQLPSLDEYMQIVRDTAGPIAIALRGLSDDEFADVKAKLEEPLAQFAAGGGYDLPGVARCAVAG